MDKEQFNELLKQLDELHGTLAMVYDRLVDIVQVLQEKQK